MAITAQMRTEISQLYVALFGRAPDGEGLGYWVHLRDQGRSLAEIANTMFATQAARSYYPTFLTHQEIIGAFYLNVLGREADAEGLAFWTARLDAPGATPGGVIVELVQVVAGYSGTDPAGKDSQALFNNRVAVAQYYGEKNGTVDGATGVLNGVTLDPASVSSTKAAIDAGTVGGVNQGLQFVLTVHQDAGAAFTGTAGNDLFLAGAAQNGAGNLIDTLQSVDVLDGGDGIDALSVTVSGAGPLAPTLRNIETIEVRFTGGDELDLANATGLKTVSVARSIGAATLRNFSLDATLAVKEQYNDVRLNGAALPDGTLRLDFDGFHGDGVPALLDLGLAAAPAVRTAEIAMRNSSVAIDSTFADAIRSATVVAEGTNGLFLTDSTASLQQLKVTGTGSLFIPVLEVVRDVDATELKGALDLTVRSQQTVSIRSGAGADKVDMAGVDTPDNAASLGAGDDVLIARPLTLGGGADGGEGRDILNVSSGDTLTAGSAKNIHGFEVLDASRGSGTYDLSLYPFERVQIDPRIYGEALTGDVTFTHAPDGFTLHVNALATGANLVKNINIQGHDYAGTTAAGTAEVVTLSCTVDEGLLDLRTVTVDGAETLAIHTGDSAGQVRVALAGAQIEKLVITGGAYVDLGNVTTIGVVRAIDASAATVGVDISMSTHARSVAFVGSSGDDAYYGSTAGDVVAPGAGVDWIEFEAPQAVRDTLVIKAGADARAEDISGDGKVTIGDDVEGIEFVVNFSTGAGANGDRLDVTNFGFSGVQRGFVNVAGKVGATTDLTHVADLFADAAAGGARGLAYVVIGVDDTYVFVDANKDGHFKAADDAVIHFTGIAGFSLVSVNL